MKNSLAFAASAVLIAAVALGLWAAPREPATVKIVRDDLVMVVTLDNGTKLKVTTKGTPLAAGTHFVKSVQFYKKDEKGRVWELRSTDRLGGIKAITCSSGQEKILDPGPPIVWHLWAKRGEGASADKVNINISAVGQYNAVYYNAAYLGRKHGPPPVLRLVGEDGKVLYTAQFPFGGSVRHTWQIPAGFKGKYKVDIQPTLGPFKWKNNREGHFFEVE